MDRRSVTKHYHQAFSSNSIYSMLRIYHYYYCDFITGALKEARNPFYAEEDTWGESPGEGWYQEYGRYMRPWYVALDRLGNHGTVMILNMHNSKLDLMTLQRDFKWLLRRAFVAHRSRVIRD